MKTAVPTPAELEQEARSFSERLKKQDMRATVVTLSGELGAGKTAFVKAVAGAFGITEHVTSPTFVLMRLYALPENSSGFTRLVHIDAYRLTKREELSALGFDDIIKTPKNLVLLEWPESVGGLENESSVRVHISMEKDQSRTLTYEG